MGTFRIEVPERYNFARDTVDRWAEDPERLAMLWVDDEGGGHPYTFRHFAERSRRVAGLLRSLGIGRGDRVLVVLGREVAWWEVMLGLIRLGAIPAPGTTLLTARDLAYRIRRTEAAAIVADPEVAERVDTIAGQSPSLRVRIVTGGTRPGWIPYEESVAAAGPDEGEDTAATDPMLIYFTSGTTGYPKMVLHEHGYPLGHRVTGELWCGLRPGDLHWNVSDTGWAKAAWSSFCGPWVAGAQVLVDHKPGKFDPQRTLRLIERHRPQSLCAPPTVYRLLVLEPLDRYDLSSLRSCVSAGEPLNPEVIHIWQRATGVTIRDGYGQTETVCVVANWPDLPVKPGSMGKPSPHAEVAIIDQEGRVLPPGQEGDIAIRVEPRRPVGIFREYWKDPEGTASRRIGPWYITGDRGIMDEDGYFWFVGRADDVIISAGYRIGPFEVESALVEHPAVAEAAVVASPDPVRGSIVKAFVVLAPGYEPSTALAAELQEHVKNTTAPYKYPREIEFVPDLPKTISGKIRRVELREREMQRKAGQAPGAAGGTGGAPGAAGPAGGTGATGRTAQG
ncbi:AMP-binding protein [Thermaerobacter sp. PB12/4term]|uniref:acyl-CoA synthetase n=1 Tax=Thermaerobacter sp. PB12/4term TaxID=2293838 RepID=UPI000E32A210|nr:AMP-binding protein [Thermaerobacter sp. PB12/4term]QIA27210.1 AMP-binding protein [Thermaerobacter sp. PB12/4term]